MSEQVTDNAAAEAAAAKALEKQQKDEARAAAKAEKDADKQAKAEAREAAKAEREAQKEAKQKERDALKAAKDEEKAAKVAEREAKRLEREAAKAKTARLVMPEQNGIRQPGPSGLCGMAWAMFKSISDAQNSACSITQALAGAKVHDPVLNEGNIRTEYARWKKFHGLSGKILSPDEEAAEAKKRQDAEDAKAAKAAAKAKPAATAETAEATA